MPQPPDDRIAAIKAQFPDRVISQLDIKLEEDADDDKAESVLTFIMTGPTRQELNFFLEEIQKTKKFKDDGDRSNAVRMATENAALAQIRWPDRVECQRAFEMRPLMVFRFADELQKLAGDGLVFRSKKL